MNKSIFIMLSVGLLAILAACAGQTETDTSLVKIKVSDNGAAGNAPIYIALAEGFFTEQRLDIELVTVNRSSEAIAAMISGDIDVVPASNSIAMMNAATNEESIRVVADRGHITKDSCTYYGMVIGKELFESGAVTGPADFVDYTIRSSGTGVNAYMLDLYVAQAGLTIDDLDLANLPSSTVRDALASKTIAASALVEPRLTGAINAGVAVQVAGLEDFADGFQISVMAFGKKLTMEDRDLGVRFMTAYLKGVKQFNEGKTARNLEIVSEYTEIPQEELEMVCWPNIWEDGHISYDSFLDYQKWSVSINDLDAIVPEDVYLDPYFAEEAYVILNE